MPNALIFLISFQGVPIERKEVRVSPSSCEVQHSTEEVMARNEAIQSCRWGLCEGWDGKAAVGGPKWERWGLRAKLKNLRAEVPGVGWEGLLSVKDHLITHPQGRVNTLKVV